MKQMDYMQCTTLFYLQHITVVAVGKPTATISRTKQLLQQMLIREKVSKPRRNNVVFLSTLVGLIAYYMNVF